MKTASSRTKGNPKADEGKNERKTFFYLFPFLLGIVTFLINGSLSFYAFWNKNVGFTADTAIGLTFASLAISILVVTVLYRLVRKRL